MERKDWSNGEEGGTDDGAGRTATTAEAAARMRVVDNALRVLALLTTAAAAIVMALAKATETLSVQVAPTLPSISVPATAKATYSSAFVYFIVANAIACGYTALGVGLSMAGIPPATAKRKAAAALPLAVADIVAVALLFSGNGAAAAIAVVGEKGLPQAGWGKVCDAFGGYCARVAAAVVASMLGSLAYLVLASFNIITLYKRSSSSSSSPSSSS